MVTNLMIGDGDQPDDWRLTMVTNLMIGD